MTRFAIRLLTLALFGLASLATPMTTPAKAATDGSTTAKKKHKKTTVTGRQMQAPATSSQSPPNMSDDPSRKISY
jgi:Ni/Co efflux regulator RcnB